METFITVVFLIVCILLIIVVLLQKGRGGGLGGILGGGGGQSAFGTRTGDVFTWITIVLVGVFLILAICATKLLRHAPQQVSAPVLIPPPKAIDKPIRVTIQCRTSEAKVFFTIDGSEPTRMSVAYDGPVRISPGMTLKAIAYVAGWKESRVQTGMYPAPAALEPPASQPAASEPATTAPAAPS